MDFVVVDVLLYLILILPMTDFSDFFLLEQSRNYKIYEILRAAFVDHIPLRRLQNLHISYKYWLDRLRRIF